MSAFFTQLNRKGQVVIPVELRQQMGLKNGALLSVKREGDVIVLRPIAHLIYTLRGSTKGAGAVREREHHRDRY